MEEEVVVEEILSRTDGHLEGGKWWRECGGCNCCRYMVPGPEGLGGKVTSWQLLKMLMVEIVFRIFRMDRGC